MTTGDGTTPPARTAYALLPHVGWQPTNSGHWTLRGLVWCGYCDQPMHPVQQPGRWRAYRCDPPCERSTAEARPLEYFAYCTAATIMPTFTLLRDRNDQTARYAELFQQVLVHNDVADVRFIRLAASTDP